MLFQEMLRDERAEGKAEGKSLGIAEATLELLEELAVIPDEVRENILSETDLEKLRKWHKLAAKADSLEQFLKEM